jgi:hypothetical protein
LRELLLDLAILIHLRSCNVIAFWENNRNLNYS